ncbi:MAG TPA: LysR substrate-binding domain-containing protein [Burkholderiales bacterium]|nr:LysR substrate-binding domain-containing protein [Burkholderiales bacterium]
MDLRQLRYFVRIVDLGSLSKAAVDLYVAQPALSRQVAALEAELKAPLLVRSVRGVTPTDAGAALYRQAQGILRQLSRIPEEVRSAGGLPAGVVSIGLPYSVSNVLTAALVAAVREKLPAVRVFVTEAVSGVLEEQLTGGRLDIGMLYETERRAGGIDERPVLVEELFLVSAGKSRRVGEIALADALDRPFILPGRNNATRRILEKAAARAGLGFEVIAEVDSASTIRGMVAAGLGVSVMSRSALHPEGAGPALSLQRIVRPTLSRALNACASRETHTRATSAVLELLGETALGLVRRGVWKGATPIP